MPSSDACSELTERTAALAASAPAPRALIAALAKEAAGIRSAPVGVLDLARGGANRVRGRGFRRRYDDGTRGQARHFATGAGATLLLGGPVAHVFLRTLGGDEPGSADDRLTTRAIEWSRLLRRGELSVAEAGAWIRCEICG